MQPIQKQRNSNLELYRIIVMLLIVCHHYVVNSGLMVELENGPITAKSLFFYVFGMWEIRASTALCSSQATSCASRPSPYGSS